MKATSVFTLILLSLSLAATSQEAVRKKHFNLKKGLAIEGYDPVAYIKNSKAVKGNAGFAVVHQGATYYFSSAANRDEFKKDPERYEPAYGGWCAYAMGKEGSKVEIDPETFKVVNGKVYLFYNKYFNNTLKSWNKNEAELKKNADAHWQKTFH